MIYNDQFVWLHFPKCAGTKIEQLFGRYFADEPGLVQDPVGSRQDPTTAWHDSIALREGRDPDFSLGDRVIVCSFRRLPAWLESRYRFELRRHPGLDHRPERLLQGRFLEADGSLSHADNYAIKFLPPELLDQASIRFVRVENFAADFKSAFGDFLDVSRIPEAEYGRKVNRSRGLLSKLLSRRDTRLPDQIHDRLYAGEAYAACPLWQRIERLAYG